jgi:hypothetical protein
MKKPFWLVLLIFGALGFHAVEAQEREETAPALTGRVIDSDAGTPLVGAFVHLVDADWGVLTDDDGQFRLPNLSRGVLSVAVEQLGYIDLIQTLQLADDAEPVLFLLTPDPILLEGIQVVTDRFERRRRAYGFSSMVLDRSTLSTSSAFDLLDLIQSRTFLNPSPCPASYMEQTCALIRGRVRPVSVYVDEFPFWGGMDFLEMIQPHELHRVEVYYSQGHVRVYTEAFMERVGKKPIAAMPLSW